MMKERFFHSFDEARSFQELKLEDGDILHDETSGDSFYGPAFVIVEQGIKDRFVQYLNTPKEIKDWLEYAEEVLLQEGYKVYYPIEVTREQ
jgi:hypothetical protein